MKERPILFRAPMVRALLNGGKTQTRRVVKPQPTHFLGGPGVCDGHGNPFPKSPCIEIDDAFASSRVITCPHGQLGDRLWVRETFIDASSALHSCVIYRADGDDQACGQPWNPSIFMPRWASRITLEITAVRVERLQDISPADAIAEGIESTTSDPGHWNWRDYLADGIQTSAIMSYASLWESINGPGSWDANPWVWVIEFKRSAS